MKRTSKAHPSVSAPVDAAPHPRSQQHHDDSTGRTTQVPVDRETEKHAMDCDSALKRKESPKRDPTRPDREDTTPNAASRSPKGQH